MPPTNRCNTQWSSSAPFPRASSSYTTRSALASARLHRRLTVEQVAKRSGLTPDQVEWLEEGRVYRFPSTDHAIEATLMLASALEIGPREARELAGLPVPPRPLDVNPAARLIGVAALSAALMAFVAFVLVPAVAGKPAACAARSGRRPGGDAAEAVEDPRRGAERRRRHQLDAPGRQPHPVARLHGQEGRARRPVRLSRERRLLLTRAAAWSRSASPASSASSRVRSRAGRTRTGWS